MQEARKQFETSCFLQILFIVCFYFLACLISADMFYVLAACCTGRTQTQTSLIGVRKCKLLQILGSSDRQSCHSFIYV